MLYDNLKSAVLERVGDAIRFNPQLLAFAAHYRFEPRPVAVARGNEKGRVERAIRYVRDAFFAARSFTDLDDLNAQAARWCGGRLASGPAPRIGASERRRAFAEEQRAAARAARAEPSPVHERRRRARRQDAVRALRPERLLGAAHPRAAHADGAGRRPSACASSMASRCSPPTCAATTAAPRSRSPPTCRPGRAQARRPGRTAAPTRWSTPCPQIRELLDPLAARAATTWARSPRRCSACSAQYGVDELHAAVVEALDRDVPHPNAVRLALERRREERGLPPASVVPLPEHLQRRDVIVSAPHARGLRPAHRARGRHIDSDEDHDHGETTAMTPLTDDDTGPGL